MQYRVKFLQVADFEFSMNREQFASFIRGLLWGILRDFESPATSDEFFVRGEMLAWKVDMFMRKWDVPPQRIKELKAWEDDEPYRISFAGLINGKSRQ